MIQNYLKVAVRNMIRFRFYSLVNLTGLAAAIACVLFISLYVYDEMSYDRFFVQTENMYRVGQEGNIGERDILAITTPSPLAQTLREEFPEIIAATRLYRSVNTVLTYGENSFLENRYYYTDPDFFRVFSYRLVKGNPENILLEPNTMVISESTAKRYFGEANPIGMILKEADGNDYRVVGVMEDAPGNTHLNIDFLASSSTFPLLENDNWLNDQFYTYIRTRDGTDHRELEQKIRILLDKYFAPQMMRSMGLEGETGASVDGEIHFFLEPVTSIYLNSRAPLQIEQVGNVSYIRFFSILAAFIMILAFINFANLTTARSFTRAREIGMRKVMGSHKGQIIRQILTESVLLTLVAFIVGLTLVELLLPLFNRISGKSLTMLAFENWLLLPSTIFLIVLMGVLAGSISSLSHASFRILDVLRGKADAGPRHLWVRAGLVVFQFSIAIGLMISTVVIYNQLHFMQSKKTGFRKDNVLVVDRAYGLEKKMDAFTQEVNKLPGVASASLVGTVPGKDGWNGLIVRKKFSPSSEVHHFRQLSGDARMIKTLGLEMVEGKMDYRASSVDTISVVLNETAAHNLGLEEPVGSFLYPVGWYSAFPMKVVGVVKDFHFRPLTETIENLMILDHWTYMPRYVAVNIESGEINQTLKAVAKLWNKLTSGQPFSYFFLDESFDQMHRAERRTSELFAIFSVLCVIIACVGLLGLASFLAEQRTREVGIRKVMGADSGQIIWLFVRDFTLWLLLANVIAWPVAYIAMKSWLQNFAYKTNFPWWAMLLAVIISGMAALLTVGYQTWIASRRKIADTIRYE